MKMRVPQWRGQRCASFRILQKTRLLAYSSDSQSRVCNFYVWRSPEFAAFRFWCWNRLLS